jgi:glycosyltransferase involved in cell wall biosynthesis
VLTLHDAYTTCPRAFRVDRQGRSCARPLSVASCLSCVPRYGHEDEHELALGIDLFAAHMRSEVLRARAVLVADESAAALVASNLDVPRAHIEVLPLPHSPRLRERLPPRPLPPPSQPLRLGYFGLLAKHKGVNDLLDAFAALCRQGLPRPAELHVFGGAETPEFAAQARARAHGLPVVFHGAYDGAVLAAAQLHVAVFPSLAFECYSLVLDEAFELGLPVVVADVGALSRRAGTAALRFPPGDVVALQHTLHEVLADATILSRLAAAIPPPPPALSAHASALAAIYARARATAPHADAPRVDPLRRAAFMLRQRESALARITPSGGPR